MKPGLAGDVELVEVSPALGEFVRSCNGLEEACDLGLFYDTFCQDAEFVDVLVATEWTGTQWVCVGHGDVVLTMIEPSFIVILTEPPESFFVEVRREW